MAAIVLLPPGGFVIQIASLCFLSAGLFADVLIIHLVLSLAYAGHLVHTLMGFPEWPGTRLPPATAAEPHGLALDALIWSALSLYVHGSCFAQLLLDERRVALSPQEEELWRMFYRRARISRLLFERHIAADGRFETYAPGDVITEPAMAPRVHILIQGRALGTVQIPGAPDQQVLLLSGDLFEYRHLHRAGAPVGFIDRAMRVVAKSRVRAFSIAVEQLERMSTGSGPMRHAWQSVIIAALAREAELNFKGAHGARDDAVTREAVEGWLDPSFAELRDDELPQAPTPGSGRCLAHPLRNLATIMYRTFHAPWPFSRGFPGMRHSAMNAVAADAASIAETSRFVELATLSARRLSRS